MQDDFSFKKKEHVRKNNEFKEIFLHGRKISGKYLYIYYYFNQENPKLGFIVSKKKRNGVERNKLRRQIREVFRLNKYQLKNVNIVVGVKKDYKYLEYQVLHDEFLLLLRRAKCLKQQTI